LLTLRPSKQYRKDRELAKRRSWNLSLLDDVVRALQEEKPLDVARQDHPLKGKWSRFRECHIKGDWVLIYATDKEKLVLALARTGSHSDMNW
jgi:mRNA interferase YafQ